MDVHRQSDRDVLRNPAGLNDTLIDLISVVSVSDTRPTAQSEAVSAEIMARAEEEIAKVEQVVAGEIAELNRLAVERGVGVVDTLTRRPAGADLSHRER